MKLGEVQLVDCGGPWQRSRSVSWNSAGGWLASGCVDKMARIWSLEGASCREVLAVSGHTAPVDRVRFHPKEAHLLATSAQDRTIRVWDVRAGSQRAMGRIDLLSHQRFGSYPSSVEWGQGDLLLVAEKNDTVYIYDSRKLDFSTRGGRTMGATPIHSFNLTPNLVEGCQFSPNAKFIVAATTLRGEGMGELRIWPWKEGSKEQVDAVEASVAFPGHTGPVYQFAFSPDGTKLATGGSDAIVGLWDVASMVCTHTIIRRTKFIRSVAFSHDSKMLASSSEEAGIDLANADNGDLIGAVELGSGDRRSGADEIAFNPKAHILACARGDTPQPVTIAKLNITR